MIAAVGNEILVQDLLKGCEYTRFEGHEADISCIAINSDETYIASGASDYKNNGASECKELSVRLWSIKTKKPVTIFKGHTKRINCLSFSQNGQLLASGSEDKTVRLWSVTQLKLLAKFTQHEDSVVEIFFSNNGKALASLNGHCLNLWSTIKFELIHEQSLRFEKWFGSFPSNVVTVSLDGAFIAISDDEKIEIWSVAAQKQMGNALLGHTDKVSCMVFSPDGKILTSGSGSSTGSGYDSNFNGQENSIRLWSVEKQQQIGHVLTGHSNKISSLAFSFNGKILASGSEDKTVRLWSLETLNSLAKLPMGHSKIITSIAFNSDNKMLASVSEDYTLRLWSMNLLTPIHKFLGGDSFKKGIYSVAFSFDGKYLACGCSDKSTKENFVQAWSMENFLPLPPLRGHPTIINSMCFNPTRNILASSSGHILNSMHNENDSIFLWSIETRELLYKISKFVSDYTQINCVAFSPDGNCLACGYEINLSMRLLSDEDDNGGILFWSLKTQNIVNQINVNVAIKSISFNHNGKVLVSGDENKVICLWSIDEQKLIGKPIIGHKSDITSISISPDSKLVASSSKDRTVKLWNAEDQTYIDTLFKGVSEVKCVLFNNDGEYIAFATGYEIGLLQRSITHESPYRYCLIRFTGTTSFSTYGSILERSQGLSENNACVLKQSKKSKKDISLSSNNSSLKTYSTAFFKPAADSIAKKDEKQKDISFDKKDENVKEDRDEVYKKEKCGLM